MTKIILKINVDNLKDKLRKDQTISVETYPDGTVVDDFWRRRVEDAKIDNCVSIITEDKKDKPKKQETEE